MNIVSSLTDKYDLLHDDGLRFAITTNGLLLNQEKIDFLNQYKVVVNFSYDAPYPFAVRGYVSDRICNLVRKLDCYSIVSNSCSYNCDYLLAYRCHKAKFPDADGIKVGFATFASSDISRDILRFDFSEIKKNLRKVCISAQLGDGFSLRFLRDILARRKTVGERFCISGLWTGMRNLPITPDGKILICHDGDICVGTVYDSRPAIAERVKDRAESNSSEFCLSCVHKDICAGFCQLETKEADGGYFACQNFLVPFFDSLKAELKEIVKPLSAEKLAWFRKEEEKMDLQIQKYLLEGQRYEKEHTILPAEMMELVNRK